MLPLSFTMNRPVLTFDQDLEGNMGIVQGNDGSLSRGERGFLPPGHFYNVLIWPW